MAEVGHMDAQTPVCVWRENGSPSVCGQLEVGEGNCSSDKEHRLSVGSRFMNYKPYVY